MPTHGKPNRCPNIEIKMNKNLQGFNEGSKGAKGQLKTTPPKANPTYVQRDYRKSGTRELQPF